MVTTGVQRRPSWLKSSLNMHRVPRYRSRSIFASPVVVTFLAGGRQSNRSSIAIKEVDYRSSNIHRRQRSGTPVIDPERCSSPRFCIQGRGFRGVRKWIARVTWVVGCSPGLLLPGFAPPRFCTFWLELLAAGRGMKMFVRKREKGKEEKKKKGNKKEKKKRKKEIK